MKATESQKRLMREYYHKNRERILAKNILYGKKYRQQVKMEVLSHYSKGLIKCAHCGETDIKVLCIDHINNDGAKHRINNKNYGGGRHIHGWLKANGFPEGYQVLCANCNLRKSYRKEKHETNLDT